MKATERAEIKERKDVVARLRMENTQLKDDVLRLQLETSRQWRRAEFWRERAKNANRRAEEERRQRLAHKKVRA